MPKAKVSPQIERFWRDLVEDIRLQRIVLPSLPDVAVRIRHLLNQHDTTIREIARIAGLDPILSSRLIRASNSPLSRAVSPIGDLRTAVTRLGLASVRNIVMSYAVEQLYTRSIDDGDRGKRKQLQEVWRHSIQVAALSHVLAVRRTTLDPEQAMLSGLIHDIGMFPIIEYASRVPALSADEAGLERILMILHGRVGELVLSSWGFSAEFLDVVRDHDRFTAEPPSGRTSYLDIVTVANLLSRVGTDHPNCRLDWSTITAFANLDLSPEESIEVMHDAQVEVQAISRIFAD